MDVQQSKTGTEPIAGTRERRADLTELPLDQSLRVVIGAQVSPINRTPGVGEAISPLSYTETLHDR